MKKLLVTAAALMVLAAPAFAYVQPGTLSQSTTLNGANNTNPRDKHQADNPGSFGPGIGVQTVPNSRDQNGDADPARPVPEPGTMAMASMGLLAIGAALRNRRTQ